MATKNKTPTVLEKYLGLPTELSTLVLLTGTLGCSTHWLSAHFIASALGSASKLRGPDASPDGAPYSVLLASWQRDLDFWHGEMRRKTGLDLNRLTQSGHFAFVDLLGQSHSSPAQVLPEMIQLVKLGISRLSQPESNRRILLILDAPDTMLAIGSCSSHSLNQSVLALRSLVQATIVSCSADYPLTAAAAAPSESHSHTLLETSCAAFLVSQAHIARLVMSVRELDTGAATDISGVLRVTKGGGAYSFDGELVEDVDEIELLYLVRKDGTTKVFERGEVLD